MGELGNKSDKWVAKQLERTVSLEHKIFRVLMKFLLSLTRRE